MLLEPTGMDRLIEPSVQAMQCACGSDDPGMYDHTLLSCRFVVSLSEVGSRRNSSYSDYVVRPDPREDSRIEEQIHRAYLTELRELAAFGRN